MPETADEAQNTLHVAVIRSRTSNISTGHSEFVASIWVVKRQRSNPEAHEHTLRPIFHAHIRAAVGDSSLADDEYVHVMPSDRARRPHSHVITESLGGRNTPEGDKWRATVHMRDPWKQFQRVNALDPLRQRDTREMMNTRKRRAWAAADWEGGHALNQEA
jgi:hypothetical protein